MNKKEPSQFYFMTMGFILGCLATTLFFIAGGLLK